MTGSVLSLNGHSAPRPPRQRGALFRRSVRAFAPEVEK